MVVDIRFCHYGLYDPFMKFQWGDQLVTLVGTNLFCPNLVSSSQFHKFVFKGNNSACFLGFLVSSNPNAVITLSSCPLLDDCDSIDFRTILDEY